VEEEGQLKIFFDESGNTGQDLLNADQPIFTMASVSLSRQQAIELMSGSGPYRGKEIRFKRLRTSKAGRAWVLEVLRSHVLSDQTAFISAYHKEYVLTTHVVDLLIEPVAHFRGLNLYERGLNIAIANLYHTVLPSMFGRKAYRGFQMSFMVMLRKRDKPSIIRFCKLVNQFKQKSRVAGPGVLLGLIPNSPDVVARLIADLPEKAIDPAIPNFVMHCEHWGDKYQTPFRAIHDHSSILEKESDSLSDLFGPDEPSVLIGYDRRQGGFPLKAESLEFAESSTDPRIQLSDVLAGATNVFLSARLGIERDSRFAVLLETTQLPALIQHVVWPSSAVTPEQLGTTAKGGIDPLEHITKRLERLRGERESKARATNVQVI
jgi:uncharacterized protein DUF3800